jgi:hypothetical protein
LLYPGEAFDYSRSGEAQRRGELQAWWQFLKLASYARLILEEHGLM